MNDEITMVKMQDEPATALDRLGGVGVNELDLSTLLRHACLSGVILARNSPKATGPELWPHYDPAGNPAFERIRSALVDAPDPAAIRREARAEALREAAEQLPPGNTRNNILALIDQEPSDG